MDQQQVILIVDDKSEFREMYRDILVSKNYTVMEAPDGEKALELLQTHKPHLILLDLVLPTIQGLEVLQKVKADSTTKDIPVLIFSVLGESADVSRGLSLGANDYAVKGFSSPQEILDKIGSLIRGEKITEHYRVQVSEGRSDAAKLEKSMNLGGLKCPACQVALLLELIPHPTRTDGRWFEGRFVCPHCNKQF